MGTERSFVTRCSHSFTRRSTTIVPGVVLVIVGTIFLLGSLGVIDQGVRELWPLIPIEVGLLIIYRRAGRAVRGRRDQTP